MPERLFEPIETGPLEGAALSHAEFEAALTTLYQLKGWDPITTVPDRQRLDELQIGWAAGLLGSQRMILRLGGHLSFYAPQKASELELEIPARIPLAELLQRLDVPAGEVALVVINGEQVELKDAYISDQDRVQLFPPIGGGNGSDRISLDFGA